MDLVAVLASRERRTLILDDFLKYIVEDCLRIVWVVDLLGHSQNVTALLYVVLHVVVNALICKLGHLDFLGCELFIKVVQV